MRDFFFSLFLPSLCLSLSFSAATPEKKKGSFSSAIEISFPLFRFVIYREFPFSPPRISRVFVREFCILLLLLLFFGIGGKHSREGTGVNHVAFLLRVVLQLHRGKSFLFRGGRSQRPVLHKFSTVFPRFFYRVVAAYLFFFSPSLSLHLLPPLSTLYQVIRIIGVFDCHRVWNARVFFLSVLNFTKRLEEGKKMEKDYIFLSRFE